MLLTWNIIIASTTQTIKIENGIFIPTCISEHTLKMDMIHYYFTCINVLSEECWVAVWIKQLLYIIDMSIRLRLTSKLKIKFILFLASFSTTHSLLPATASFVDSHDLFNEFIMIPNYDTKQTNQLRQKLYHKFTVLWKRRKSVCKKIINSQVQFDSWQTLLWNLVSWKFLKLQVSLKQNYTRSGK